MRSVVQRQYLIGCSVTLSLLAGVVTIVWRNSTESQLHRSPPSLTGGCTQLPNLSVKTAHIQICSNFSRMPQQILTIISWFLHIKGLRISNGLYIWLSNGLYIWLSHSYYCTDNILTLTGWLSLDNIKYIQWQASHFFLTTEKRTE